jgi:hypothetical protein
LKRGLLKPKELGARLFTFNLTYPFYQKHSKKVSKESPRFAGPRINIFVGR